MDNPGRDTSITDVDRRVDNQGIDINAVNGEANGSGISKANIDIEKKADKQAVLSNKAYMFFFFLYNIFFILSFFSELKTIFAFLFIVLLFSVTSVKQKAPFFK